MPDHPEEAAFERRIVTVLFADLVGFTSLSEQLDPEDVATVQDAYFATVRETVARHGGQLEKFIGDAAMAVFGIPKARDDDAERAIRAGLALIGAVELLGARLGLAGDDGDAGLRLRVGVNSGEVVSAESGPDTGRVTGDTVNLAARFQGAADPGTVLVGELTSLSAADAVVFEPMGGLDLKGKAEPVPAWRVVGLRPERSREDALGALRAPLLGREGELGRLESALGEVVDARGPGAKSSSRRLGSARAGSWPNSPVGRRRLVPRSFGPGFGPMCSGPAEPVSQLLVAALRSVDGASRETAPHALARRLTPPAWSLRAPRSWPPRCWTRSGRRPWQLRQLRIEMPASRRGSRPSTRSPASEPTAWLVEDIHWAGGDLLAFLAQAATWPSRGGRLVVSTARPSVLEHLAEGTSVLELPPLPALEAE